MPEKEIEDIKRKVRKWSELEVMIQRFTQRIFVYGVTPKDIKNLEKEILEKYVLKSAVGEAIDRLINILNPEEIKSDKSLNRNIVKIIQSELKKAVEGL